MSPTVRVSRSGARDLSDLDPLVSEAPMLTGKLSSAGQAISHRRTFPGRIDAVAGARRFLAGVLAGSPVAEAAELVLGELGANAVLHSRSRQPGGVFTVRTEIAADRVRLEVTDLGGPWLKDAASAGGGAEDEHGRGLEIVGQLASLWGVITGPRSRTVWCEFAHPKR